MDPNVQPQQPVIPQPVQRQAPPEPTPKKSVLPKILLIIVGVTVILGLIGGAYYLGKMSSQGFMNTKDESVVKIQPSPTPIDSTFLESFPFTIPFSASQIEWENYLSMNMLVGSLIQIPQTGLQLIVPATFDKSTNSKDTNLNLIPSLTFIRPQPKIIYDIQQCRVLENVTPHNVQPYITQEYCQPLIAEFGKYFQDVQPGVSKGEIFAISVVTTPMSPQSWIKENIKPQGSSISTTSIQPIQMNGFTFYSVQAGCCSEYDLAYVLPYVTPQGEKMLIVFTTNSSGKSSDSQRSIILDKILSSLNKKS